MNIGGKDVQLAQPGTLQSFQTMIFPNLAAAVFRIIRVSRENLWLMKVKEAREIASDGNRKKNRRIGPRGHSQGNPQNPENPRG